MPQKVSADTAGKQLARLKRQGKVIRHTSNYEQDVNKSPAGRVG